MPSSKPPHFLDFWGVERATARNPNASAVKRPGPHASGRAHLRDFAMAPVPVPGMISPMTSLGCPSVKVR
ncbi:hypothetical protein N7509_004025 [Penicillium cosmopolitanum]|uniref:Uncharacterized protein n=1 Tax=Penicillium cosmopolitanum TaxID=1131564 RepID=A0A9W9W624_9EURO|nr:uncharacterized protein N7509_004025 [Penicillium cosmopolitanum]KAJ5404154.1 hypothetical protein N7509_004025 [Penicillium cosmopolitanum]